jgi:hypothetical protein
MALLMQREGDDEPPDGGGGERPIGEERALPSLAAWFSLAAPLIGLPPLRLGGLVELGGLAAWPLAWGEEAGGGGGGLAGGGGSSGAAARDRHALH